MNLKAEAIKTVKEAASTSFTLFKIMIPITIIIKILAEYGLIELIGENLTPVMKFLGLPGEFGLVWATAMITNLYGGIIVLANLAADNTYSVAQVSILAIMMLVAHNLPIESRIAQKAGVKLWFTLVQRILMAIVFGWVLFFIFSSLSLFNDEAKVIFAATQSDANLQEWILGQFQTYLMIFLIILSLVTFIRILKKTGIIDKLNSFLEPGLKVLGMSKNAAPVTIIGLTLGLAYGGGLIIKEAKSQVVTKKDAFLSLSFMNMSHSIIEDTLLMIAIGATVVGVLLFRVVFSIFIMVILIQIIKRISEKSFSKYFCN